MTQAIKRKLLNALGRLLKGEPENLELGEKAREGKLIINNRAVEKEANLSVGVLLRHEDIRDLIKMKSLEARSMQDGSR